MKRYIDPTSEWKKVMYLSLKMREMLFSLQLGGIHVYFATNAIQFHDYSPGVVGNSPCSHHGVDVLGNSDDCHIVHFVLFLI